MRAWLHMSWLAAVFGFGAGATCRSPIYAPPVRGPSAVLATPFDPGGGQVSVDLGVGIHSRSFWGTYAALTTEQRLTVGITPWLAVEGGAAEYPDIDDRGVEIAMGSLGFRLVAPFAREFPSPRLGFGVGAGLGEHRTRVEYGVHPGTTVGALAYGGYTDIDVGVQTSPGFGLGLNLRYQVGARAERPTTHWLTAGLVTEFGADLFFSSFAFGYWGYHNGSDGREGGWVNWSIGFRWGLADGDDASGKRESPNDDLPLEPDGPNEDVR